jgi:hypothetical protein
MLPGLSALGKEELGLMVIEIQIWVVDPGEGTMSAAAEKMLSRMLTGYPQNLGHYLTSDTGTESHFK